MRVLIKNLLVLFSVLFIADFSYSQSITIDQPASGNIYQQGDVVSFRVTTSGSVSQVDYVISENGVVLSNTTGDFSFDWTIDRGGDFTILAEAKSNDGNTLAKDSINIKINGIYMLSPLKNDEFSINQNFGIYFNVSVFDENSSFNKVEYKISSTNELISSQTGGNFSFNWFIF